MKVLFDVTSLLPKSLSSDGFYTKHLFRVLRGIGVDISPIYKVPKGIKENFVEYHLNSSAKKFYGMFAPKGAILHGPGGSLLSESDKFKKVVSINDLSMFREGLLPPGLTKQLQTHMKEMMQTEVKAVIVPTYEVHNEFLVRFPKLVSKVHVVSPGCDHILDSSSSSDFSLVNGPHFLFAGTIDKKSNLSGVVKAFNSFAEIKNGVQLLIVGDNGYGADAIHKLISSSPHKERISVVGQKSDSQMKAIYSRALGLIIPSMYSGYSFPLVEAMRMNCPVVTSTTGSLKEVGGEAVHLVNPKDPEQIMGGMERIFSDRVYRDKLVKAGQELTQGMNWLKTAREVASIYQKL